VKIQIVPHREDSVLPLLRSVRESFLCQHTLLLWESYGKGKYDVTRCGFPALDVAICWFGEGSVPHWQVETLSSALRFLTSELGPSNLGGA